MADNVKVYFTGPAASFGDRIVAGFLKFEELFDSEEYGLTGLTGPNFFYHDSRYIFLRHPPEVNQQDVIFVILYDLQLPDQIELVDKELTRLRRRYRSQTVLAISIGDRFGPATALSPASTYNLPRDLSYFNITDIPYRGGQTGTIFLLLDTLKLASRDQGESEDEVVSLEQELPLLVRLSYSGRYDD